MQGRRSFTFEHEGTFHHPRFYNAKVKFSLKLMNTLRVQNVGNTGYQQFRVTNDEGVHTDSPYGPVIVPNWIADFYFEKATIEVLGGTEIEPGTQTYQITKLLDFHTKVKPKEAAFKYSNLVGYHENYDTQTADQKYQLPITINPVTGPIGATAGVNYEQITQAQLTGETGANNNFQYTTKGAAALAAKFHQGQEVHFEVPLRRLCRIAKCKQMFPARKNISSHYIRQKSHFYSPPKTQQHTKT